MIEILQMSSGKRFLGYPNDAAFQLMKQGNEFIDTFIKEQVDRYVKPDSVCIDAGANLGYVSVYLSKIAHKVYSFEPQKVVFLQLCGNLFLNECFNVKPFNLGVFSSTKSFDFSDIQDGWVGATDFTDYSKIKSIGSISLREKESGSMVCTRLDSIINEKVDFIKFDCQGGDIDGIFGAEDLISKYHPIIVFEYEEELSQKNYGKTLSDIFPLVKKYNYTMSRIYNGNFLLD